MKWKRLLHLLAVVGTVSPRSRNSDEDVKLADRKKAFNDEATVDSLQDVYQLYTTSSSTFR